MISPIHMPYPAVIGLTGQAGAGKDTVAAIMAETLDQAQQHAVRMSVADPMRAALSAMGIEPHALTDRALKEQSAMPVGISPRQMLQTLGDWGRCLRPDFWLLLLARRIQHTPGWIVIVPDVRLQIEADWVRANDGVIVRVLRPGVAPVRAHATETEPQSLVCDYELHNDGSRHELVSSTRRLLARMAADRTPLEA